MTEPEIGTEHTEAHGVFGAMDPHDHRHGHGEGQHTHEGWEPSRVQARLQRDGFCAVEERGGYCMSRQPCERHRQPDYRVSDDPAWQPYRDPDTGEVITVTPAQCAAITRALGVWLEVAPVTQSNALLRKAVTEGRMALSTIHMKSCLLGRLLYQGKAPLVDAPPVVNAAPDYSVEVPR